MHRRSPLRQDDHSTAYHQHFSPLLAAAAKVQPPSVGELRGYDHMALAAAPNTGNALSSMTIIPDAGDVAHGSYTVHRSDRSTQYSSSVGFATAFDQMHASVAGASVSDAAELSLSSSVAPEPKTTGLHSVGSSTDSFPVALGNAIDGAVLHQLLPQRVASSSGECVARSLTGRLGRFSELGDLSARMPASDGVAAGQRSAACPAAAKGGLSAAVQQLLLSLPTEQQKLFTQALAASSDPQQLLSAVQAGRADAAAACADLANTALATSNSNIYTSPSSSQPGYAQSLQQWRLQAMLVTQQQACGSACSAWAASPLSPAGQDLMRLFAAEQQALAHQPRTNPTALSRYGALDGLSHSMAPTGSTFPQCHQAVSKSPAADPWSLTSLSAPAAVHETMAAAAAMLQRQQQQAQLASMMRAAVCSSEAAAAACNQLTTQYLSAQLAAAAAAAAAATYSAVLGPMPHAPAATPTRLSTHGVIPGGFNQSAHLASRGAVSPTSLGMAKGVCAGVRGRDSRCVGPRTSDSVLQHSCDGSSRSLGLGRPGAFDNASAAAAAGVCISALSPATFTDHWGTDDTIRERACSQDGSSLPGYSPSSASSSSESALSICSRRSSLASVGSPVASGRLSSIDGEVFTMELGLHSRDSDGPDKFSSLFAADTATADAVKCASSDQSPACVERENRLTDSNGAALDLQEQATVSTAARSAAATQPAISCPVWYPTAREKCGDDSWYLQLPPTCRLFVGNIGCWVDEALLLSYFGKYGNVVDVQVMWNTKMLARGRRVNREFAFISYSTPLEAARAVRADTADV
eukprot:GHUV01004509.1.p1 GENE.GHUV01004509.1~~GHUV01004509.1.p1  ORF type:complete len:808 (+),score=279.60 GHUV01004509.1:271-2694(+)